MVSIHTTQPYLAYKLTTIQLAAEALLKGQALQLDSTWMLEDDILFNLVHTR